MKQEEKTELVIGKKMDAIFKSYKQMQPVIEALVSVIIGSIENSSEKQLYLMRGMHPVPHLDNNVVKVVELIFLGKEDEIKRLLHPWCKLGLTLEEESYLLPLLRRYVPSIVRGIGKIVTQQKTIKPSVCPDPLPQFRGKLPKEENGNIFKHSVSRYKKLLNDDYATRIVGQTALVLGGAFTTPKIVIGL